MAYLEELLPEFRKGAKIRRTDWGKCCYIQWHQRNIITNMENDYKLTNQDIESDKWEIYIEHIDWDYIIKNKCLCWFWDEGNEENKHIGILKEVKKYGKYKFSIFAPDNYVNDVSFANCRPVRRDEVTFYEDKKDD